MTDRRDTDRELATLLSELEETLTELRGALEEGGAAAGQPARNRGRGADRHVRSPFPRPPGMRELLRFTEQQTIPTLVAILEANIRLLQLAAAALRAVDPERSAVEPTERGAVSRALDTGGRLSTDRLASGLEELQAALSGAEATDPEARQLLEEAERLSEEVRARMRESDEGRHPVARQSDAGATGRGSSDSDDAVRIEVEDATSDETPDDATEPESGVDVDAELDSIREEMREDAEAEANGEGGVESDDETGGDESADGE